VKIANMVVRIKEAWRYILEGITLINLNVVYVTLRQKVNKSYKEFMRFKETYEIKTQKSRVLCLV
jgi:hypothetical protein